MGSQEYKIIKEYEDIKLMMIYIQKTIKIMRSKIANTKNYENYSNLIDESKLSEIENKLSQLEQMNI